MKRDPIEARRDVSILGYRLLTWFDEQRGGRAFMSYRMVQPAGEALFEGKEYSPAPSNGIDSDDSLVELLAWLTLQPGDTDDDYFDDYTQEQLEWLKSSDAEEIRWRVSAHEEDDDSDHHCTMVFTDWED